MLATYAASRHRQIVPCCMISSVSHDNVSRLVTDRSMCFATALDKAFENIACMSAILRCQAKNRFYESTQRLIQPRRVLCFRLEKLDDPRHIGMDKLQQFSGIEATRTFFGVNYGKVRTIELDTAGKIVRLLKDW